MGAHKWNNGHNSYQSFTLLLTYNIDSIIFAPNQQPHTQRWQSVGSMSGLPSRPVRPTIGRSMVGSGNFNVGPGLGLDPIRTDILNIKYRPDRLKVGKFSRPDRPEPGFDRDSTGIRFGFPMYLGDFSKRDDVTGEMINSTLKDESPVTF